MQINKLVIAGFGGHARSAADVAVRLGYESILFIDVNAQPGEMFHGHRVVDDWGSLDPSWTHAYAASGDPAAREAQCTIIRRAGLELVSLISPLASVGIGAEIGVGSFVGHHAHVGPNARIGISCIVNTGAIVEHDASVGDFSHVSVHATVAGSSHVGRNSLLGVGSTVIDKISLADDIVIGAGAVVVSSLRESGTYVGVPARRVSA